MLSCDHTGWDTGWDTDTGWDMGWDTGWDTGWDQNFLLKVKVKFRYLCWKVNLVKNV